MMGIYQTKRLWASLSPRLVKQALGHLPPNHENDNPGKQDGRTHSSNAKKQHYILPASRPPIDPEVNFGTASIKSETHLEVR